MRWIRLALLLATGWLTPTAALAQLPETSRAYTTASLRLRAEASTEAAILAVMPAGAPLEVFSCSTRWCEVGFRSLHGFAAKQYLDSNPPAETLYTGRGYTNSQGIWVPSPTRTPTGTAPSGASAQCRDGTFSFSMSRRGTCSHHGGVARWL